MKQPHSGFDSTRNPWKSVGHLPLVALVEIALHSFRCSSQKYLVLLFLICFQILDSCFCIYCIWKTFEDWNNGKLLARLIVLMTRAKWNFCPWDWGPVFDWSASMLPSHAAWTETSFPNFSLYPGFSLNVSSVMLPYWLSGDWEAEGGKFEICGSTRGFAFYFDRFLTLQDFSRFCVEDWAFILRSLALIAAGRDFLNDCGRFSKIWKDFAGRLKISQNLGRFPEIWEAFGRLFEIIEDFYGRAEIWLDFGRFCRILEDFAGFYKPAEDLSKLWKILLDFGRFKGPNTELISTLISLDPPMYAAFHLS